MIESSVLASIEHAGILPVVVLDDAADALPLARSLSAADLGCAEVTLRTSAGEAAIRAMSSQPGLLLGAGTVLDSDQARHCISAGARFVVSPGFDEDVVATCRQLNVPVLPGIATATELQYARRAGLRAVKFFPAEPSGGLSTLKALAAPFHDMRFVPTGGIGPSNVSEYLRTSAVLAVGGSWMVPRDLIRQHRWDEIIELCQAAVRTAKSCRVATGPAAQRP